VIIVWDEPKRLANLDKHGFDFTDLTDIFFDNSIIIPAKADRLMAIGHLDDGTIAVIFIRLGAEGVSVISMRNASVKERKLIE
jgi:uncharacterized DUF497 family protein